MTDPIQTIENDIEAALQRLSNFLSKGSGSLLISDIEAAAADVPGLLTAFHTLVSNANVAGVETLTQELINDIAAIKPTPAALVGILNGALAIEPTVAQLLFNALTVAGYIAV